MISACVLVGCHSGRLKTVLHAIKQIEHVTRSFPALGRWDIIVEIVAPDIQKATASALLINNLKGVKQSETLIEAKVEGQ